MPGLPADITCAADYERHALALLDPPIAAWLSGGAGEEHSLHANREAFARLQLYNRVLRDFSSASTALRLFGQRLAHPLLLAPVAYHALLHADGELASARAAAATDTPLVLSSQSSRSLEEVAAVGGARWLQLYLQPRRQDSLALIRRAEDAGYTALVLTLDAPVQSPNRRALALGFQLPAAVRAVNLPHDAGAPTQALHAGASRILHGYMATAPQPADIEWLRAQTALPLIAKGISHPDDAALLLELGADAIAVSNHGGRALDGAPAALAVLPGIRGRVGADVPILFDGGVRSGSDAFKALALGATAVMLGRLPLYGLAVGGDLGMAHVLKLLREELELCMALCGCAELSQIDSRALAHTAFLQEGGRPC